MIKKLLLTSVACLGTFTFVSAQVSYSENTITHGGVTYNQSQDFETQPGVIDEEKSSLTYNNLSLSATQKENADGDMVTRSYDINVNIRQETTYLNRIITTYVLPNAKTSSNINLSNWSIDLDENKPEWPNSDIARHLFLGVNSEDELEITDTELYGKWEKIIIENKATIEQQSSGLILKKGSDLTDYSCSAEKIESFLYYLTKTASNGTKRAWPIIDLHISNTKKFNYKNSYHNYIVLEIPSTFAIDNTVTSVTISNTVTSIADEVFANATGVSTIALENGSDNFSLADVSTDSVRSFYLYRNSDNKLITTCNSSTKRILELPDGYSVLEGANKGKNLTIVDIIDQDSKIAAYEAGYIYNAGISKHLAPSTSLNLTTGYKVMENLNINNEAANCLVFFSETSANGKSISGDNVVVNGTCNNFVITDKVAYNNEVRNFTATNVTYKRTLNEGVWSSVVLPCSFKNTNLKVADLTEFDGNTFTYTILSNQEMATCTPYMIKNTGENTSSIESANHDVTVSKSNASVAKPEINGATFKGTFSETQNNTGNTFYTYNNAGNFVFVKSGAGSKIMPFHSYIEVANTSSAPSIRYIDEMTGTIEEIDNQTAIEAIEENAINNAPIFNMNGNRVAAPVKGQMYINNGKKFIVK